MNTDEAGSTDMPKPDPIIGEPRANWATLADFKVEVLGHTKINARCYKNTRQQVPIKVTLDARDENGIKVPLTAAQMRDLILCYYESGEPMGGWSRVKNQYDYNFLPTREDGTELDPLKGEDRAEATESTITLYMATSMVEKKLDARIVSPTGAVYRARDFDSWINVVGVDVVIHKYSAFALENRGGPNSVLHDVDVYYLKFNANNSTYSIRGSHHPDYPFNQKHYSWIKDGWSEKAQIAYNVGEKTVQRYGHAEFAVNDAVGQANVVRISNWYYAGESRDIKPRVVYYDQYGNPGMVRYVNSSNGNTISIADAGDPPKDPAIYGE